MDASENSAAKVEWDARLRAPELLAWCGTLTLAGMVRAHAPLDWVAPAWALLVVALAWLARRGGRARGGGRRVFIHQAILLSFVVLFRAWMHNFYERSYFAAPAGYSRALTVGVTVGLLFAGLAFVLRRMEPKAEAPPAAGEWRWLFWLESRPEQVIFFCALLLLTTLLAEEFDGGMITVAWGVEAVVVFMFALWVGQRSFRLAGLGILMLCLGKIAVVDFWRLGMRDRAITFLVLGGALTWVSILYSRKRELFRRFL
jgi:hypothetical protein